MVGNLETSEATRVDSDSPWLVATTRGHSELHQRREEMAGGAGDR